MFNGLSVPLTITYMQAKIYSEDVEIGIKKNISQIIIAFVLLYRQKNFFR